MRSQARKKISAAESRESHLSRFSVAVLCGGPSPERGISLNSTRSLADHLSATGVDVVPYYFDFKERAYRIERAHLYSNTPSDFDFKLQEIATPLSEKELVKELQSHSLVFPVIHGKFGEDGQIQKFLEKYGIEFVGSPSTACEQAFDKYTSSVVLTENNFPSVPTLLIEKGKNNATAIEKFFTSQTNGRAIVKPARSGSSIGVMPVTSLAEITQACTELWERDIDDRLVLQPFVDGIEFTVILIENRFGMPVALFPTEIEVNSKANEIFDYRKKYLPTRDRRYFCPPRFDVHNIDHIRTQAAQLFRLFGMRDYARFDGWILSDGTIVFTDFNPVSGMEQNSFLFQQAAQIGMSHRDIAAFLIAKAAHRAGTIADFERVRKTVSKKSHLPAKKMAVLFGGATAERQVSVMSGTNVWLKLKGQIPYVVEPYVLEQNNDTVWHVPYYSCLNHTVEEIIESCKRAVAHKGLMQELREKVQQELAFAPEETSETVFTPHTHSLKTLLDKTDFLFIGLHGGMGEDGTLQKILEKKKIPFNGPGSEVSRICMDKFETGRLLSGLEKEGIYSAPKDLVSVQSLQLKIKDGTAKQWWKELCTRFQTESIIAKPHADGCSAGCVQLRSYEDFIVYFKMLVDGVDVIPAGTFLHQSGSIEMPHQKMTSILFEKWIVTDDISVKNNTLNWKSVSNWIEVTVGVLGHAGKMHVLSPSLTVSRSGVLSLEEKFQGGTGVNITPPPASHISPEVVKKVQARIKKVCDVLKIEGYARLDAFMQTKTGEVIVIEVNTLPALTPSTVFYHQGLAETPKLYPRDMLRRIVELGEERFTQ